MSCTWKINRFFFVGKWYVVKYVTCLSYNFIGQDCELMKHFAGPTPTQFEVLYDFFNDIDLLKKTNEWNIEESSDIKKLGHSSVA